MLLIKTVVRPSAIEGLGLFATGCIPKGTLTYKRDDLFATYFSHALVKRLPLPAFEFIRRYGWRVAPDLWCVMLDNSRFTNHSKTPNIGPATSDDGLHACVALRDIRDGEEITEDYSEYDPDFHLYAHEFGEPRSRSKRESSAW